MPKLPAPCGGIGVLISGVMTGEAAMPAATGGAPGAPVAVMPALPAPVGAVAPVPAMTGAVAAGWVAVACVRICRDRRADAPMTSRMKASPSPRPKPPRVERMMIGPRLGNEGSAGTPPREITRASLGRASASRRVAASL